MRNQPVVERNTAASSNEPATIEPATETSIFFGLMLALLLALALLLGLGDSIHSRLLTFGESLWPDYYLLNPDLRAPTCSTTLDVDAEVQRQVAETPAEEDSWFDEVEVDEADIRQSVENALAQCHRAHQTYAQLQARLTPDLIAYKTVERGFATALVWLMDAKKYLFLMVLIVGAVPAALKDQHIALAPAINPSDRLLSHLFQLAANLALTYSFFAYWQHLSNLNPADRLIPLQLLWLICFWSLATVNGFKAVQLLRRYPRHFTAASLRTVPLYAWMVLLSFVYFALMQNHGAGLAILLNQLSNLANIFINVGLYVLVGMTLKHTRLPTLFFDLLRPWNLQPAALAALLIFATAWPTALTGASGIFILAVGGLIYDEMRKAGSNSTLAMTTTAMSGSLGVVLNPCLLVVVIAALNKEVTTSQLYGWGLWVYLLSAGLFAIAVFATQRRGASSIPNGSAQAWRGTYNALRALLPYMALMLAIVLLFKFGLAVDFNALSAPLLLPVILLGIVGFERIQRALAAKQLLVPGQEAMNAPRVIAQAATHSGIHIGALFLIIAASTCLGGVIERSELMHAVFPTGAYSLWWMMFACILFLVVIGMFLDPFGAVILVTATLAAPALQAGIDPVHFWMVALVAFELGYLTPPVALNQLLTRQVVGVQEWGRSRQERYSHVSFFRRHENVLLPLMVVGTTLLAVGFIPLSFY